MLDLASVRLFILAVEFGNLTRAAEAAGTVQPVVSARIKALEAALGRKLLERTPRFVRPTTAGVAFLAKAQALMAAHDEAARFDGEPRMRFAVGASDHALGTGLEHVIRHVRTALPVGSAIELRFGMSQHVRAAFDEGELDAAIIRREAGGSEGEVWARIRWAGDPPKRRRDLTNRCPSSRWARPAASVRLRSNIWTRPISDGGKRSPAAAAWPWLRRSGRVSASLRWGRSRRDG